MADSEPGEGGRASVWGGGGVLLWNNSHDGDGAVGNGASTLESLRTIPEGTHVVYSLKSGRIRRTSHKICGGVGGGNEVPYKTLRKLNKYYLPDSHGLMNKTSVKTFSENINHV